MAKESAKSVVDEIRSSLKNPPGGGGSMPKLQAFVPKDGEKRFRFLSEFDAPTKVRMHGKWQELMPQPCLKYYKKPCPFCKADGYRTFETYFWTVYEYANSEKGSEGRRRIFGSEARPNQPMEDLLEIFDENGTIKDRDLRVVRKGERQSTRYRVKQVQKEATEFEGAKSKPFSPEKVFTILGERLVLEAKASEAEEDEDEKDEGDDDDD